MLCTIASSDRSISVQHIPNQELELCDGLSSEVAAAWGYLDQRISC